MRMPRQPRGGMNSATAIPIYRSLAAKGDVAAINRLGFFYTFGWGVKRDWLEAAKWYNNAAERGDESAVASLCAIGREWRSITHTDIDPTLYQLVKKAATKGNATAQFSLGAMNYPLIGWGAPGFDGGKGNLPEALIWFRRAADQGDVDAQVALGIAYEGGIGVPQDYVEAHKWYNLAAARTKDADFRAIDIERRDAVALKMTPTQIAEAQKLAREWKPTKQP